VVGILGHEQRRSFAQRREHGTQQREVGEVVAGALEEQHRLGHRGEVLGALEAAGFALEETKDSARGLTLSLLEPLRIVPRGTCAVSSLLNAAADALVAAGRAGIFTPMLFFKARKR
jgi:hypothetical protein